MASQTMLAGMKFSINGTPNSHELAKKKNIVTKSIGKKMYTTKFTYLHSSQKEAFHVAFLLKKSVIEEPGS